MAGKISFHPVLIVTNGAWLYKINLAWSVVQKLRLGNNPDDLLYLRTELVARIRIDFYWRGQRAGVWRDEAPYILFLWLDKLTNSCHQKELCILRLKSNQRNHQSKRGRERERTISPLCPGQLHWMNVRCVRSCTKLSDHVFGSCRVKIDSRNCTSPFYEQDSSEVLHRVAINYSRAERAVLSVCSWTWLVCQQMGVGA